jgi:hypothetical protein
MRPKDVTSREAIRRAMSEYGALGREAFLAKYGFGKATKFVVVDGDREYDSKALLAAAHGFEHPTKVLSAPTASAGAIRQPVGCARWASASQLRPWPSGGRRLW